MTKVKPKSSMVLKEATIEYTVQNFSQLKDAVSSPTCTIQHLPWNVLVKPFYETDLGKLPFGLFVICDGNDSTNWTCRADVEFNIYPLNKKFRVPYFRIKPELSMVLKEATIEYTVQNISKLKDSISSPTCTIQHLPWNVLVKPSYETDIGKRPFGLSVTCDGNDSTNWTCRADVEFNIYSFNKKCRVPFSRRRKHTFSTKANTTGFEVLWEKITTSEKRLIENDSIILEVCIHCHPENSEETNADCSVVETVFRHTIKNISKIQKPFILGPFPALNLSWKIIAYFPTKPTEPQSLGLHLQCNKDVHSDTWNCDARIEFRLLNHQKSDEKLCRIIQHQFSGKENTAGVDDFIQLKDLLNVAKGFIKDDSIIVEVYVIPAKFDLQACLSVREGTFWFKFENVSKITGDQLSSPCTIGNFSWKIVIKPFKKADEELYLACYLRYGQVNSSTSSSCDAIATMKLVSFEKDKQSHKQKTPPKHFTKEIDSWGFSRFILWKDLMDSEKGFVKNDSMTIKIHVKILEEPTESIEIK